MTDKQFNTIFREACADQNKEIFVSDWALSSIFDESEDLIKLSEEIAAIWEVAHLSIKEIRAATGLSQIKFCERFCIPRRTLENWEAGTNECPDYTRLMLAQLVGLYKR